MCCVSLYFLWLFPLVFYSTFPIDHHAIFAERNLENLPALLSLVVKNISQDSCLMFRDFINTAFARLRTKIDDLGKGISQMLGNFIFKTFHTASLLIFLQWTLVPFYRLPSADRTNLWKKLHLSRIWSSRRLHIKHFVKANVNPIN